MGAIADGLVAYGQPLIDATDGSSEQIHRAMLLVQLCFNLALTPENKRDEFLEHMRRSLKMDDQEFAEFQRDIVLPMIARHEEMFPRMHQKTSSSPWLTSDTERTLPLQSKTTEKKPAIDRYAPCPCNSGEKYKFCCGKKGR